MIEIRELVVALFVYLIKRWSHRPRGRTSLGSCIVRGIFAPDLLRRCVRQTIYGSPCDWLGRCSVARVDGGGGGRMSAGFDGDGGDRHVWSLDSRDRELFHNQILAITFGPVIVEEICLRGVLVPILARLTHRRCGRKRWCLRFITLAGFSSQTGQHRDHWE